jgi:fructose-1,6-bisphosphatase/inositol monophosphatase family enzyme
LRCAREGAAIALAGFRGERTVAVKGRGNVVTDADVDVEVAIKRIIAAEFPDHLVLSEETAAGTDPRFGWVWVVDPIDGTKNYSIGIPFWCVNVALCHEGEPVVGVTYDAVHDERFTSARGEGAFLNGVRIHASERPNVQSSVIGVDLGYDDARGKDQIALLGKIFPGMESVRILGSAALAIAYAACGRLDLFTHTNIAPWDIGAGMLLMRESGGVMTDRAGAQVTLSSGGIVAGGRMVHEDFMGRYSSMQGDGRGGLRDP